jgi:tRNA-specific 2-thiouridylase
MTEVVAISLSGGVDSLAAGHLLKNQGKELIAVHFVTGYESGSKPFPDFSSGPDPVAAARDRIAPLAEKLGAPLRIIDIRSEFKDTVVRYFTETYASGKTPNPCLVCNPVIKFGTILHQVQSMGAQRLATGHYARIRIEADGTIRLLRGRDAEKEQSYFLAFLTPEKLRYALFPLGDWHKTDVIAMAQENGLRPALSRESQDICFIPDTGYADFLAAQAGFDSGPGPIEHVNGRLIGEHQGLFRYTVGQRRGINIPASEPYYVVRLDPGKNRLVVGHRKDLEATTCRVENVRWLGPVPTGPIRAHTRVRYRHQAAASRLVLLDAETLDVRFDTPQSAITPGQGAVFYREDEVLGAGFIV